MERYRRQSTLAGSRGLPDDPDPTDVPAGRRKREDVTDPLIFTSCGLPTFSQGLPEPAEACQVLEDGEDDG